MIDQKLTIGFVRRRFARGGGAEAYLKRLAQGVTERGHSATLYTAEDWPPNEWKFGRIIRLEAKSATDFADKMELSRRTSDCDLLMSLERIWRCDVYRAGDGVHRAWLRRRAEMAGPFQKIREFLNRKHAQTLALERSLFARGGAGLVIANSQMVKEEITAFYGFPGEKIDVVYNGVPVGVFRRDDTSRAKIRKTLGLQEKDVAVLFAGSGWERKGLRLALAAIEASGSEMRLLVAGRGDARKFHSSRVQFLGVVEEMAPLYGAADIFLLPTIYDPFSNACLEALAAGLPVITTRANGFSEIMTNGVHGTTLEKTNDVAEVADALRFWSDPVRRAASQHTCNQLANRFDISANVEQTLRILFQIAASAAST